MTFFGTKTPCKAPRNRSVWTTTTQLPLVAMLVCACGGSDTATGDSDNATTTPTSTGTSGETTAGPTETTTAATSETTGDSETTTDASETEGGTTGVPGEDEVITVFDKEHVYFGSENRRTVDVEVSFPEEGLTYESIILGLGLSCPNGLCDHWDRYGTLGVVRAPGAEDEDYVEVARFITPYRVGGTWNYDVTDLRPLLRGDVTFRVHIDTWVGPGHDQGEGWLVDVLVQFTGGVPAREVLDVSKLWYINYGAGNPDNPPEGQVYPVNTPTPAEATGFALRSLITGHGFGNTNNCAEFCPLEHGYLVNSNAHQRTVWRDDCAETGVPGQQGTWTYPRAGWCPGADVRVWEEDVTNDIVAGQPAMVTYGMSPYENTCKPGADPCVGCTAGATCEDGHGQPYYYMSAVLVSYR